jgi:microcystin-dependent protein
MIKRLVAVLLAGLSVTANAGLITHSDYVAGTSIAAATQNTNENTIVNEFNGNIESTNIKDGTIAVADLSSAVQANFLPAGLVAPYGGSTAPTGWLLCDGSAVDRTTYATLFAVVGTSFGSGNGSTTFNLPDMSSRTVMGATTAGSFATIGFSTGSLILAVTGTTSSNGAHTHVLVTQSQEGSLNTLLSSAFRVGVDHASGDSGPMIAPQAGGAGTLDKKSATTDSQGAHTHTFTDNSPNLQPSIVMKYIIKY